LRIATTFPCGHFGYRRFRIRFASGGIDIATGGRPPAVPPGVIAHGDAPPAEFGIDQDYHDVVLVDARHARYDLGRYPPATLQARDVATDVGGRDSASAREAPSQCLRGGTIPIAANDGGAGRTDGGGVGSEYPSS
jgi:hypothetical protein